MTDVTCDYRACHQHVQTSYSLLVYTPNIIGFSVSRVETLTQSLTVSQDSLEAIPTLIPPRVSLYNRYNFGPPTAEDILHGTHAIDLSHAGHSGELSELVSEDMKKLR